MSILWQADFKENARQTLEVCIELVSQEINILDDVFIRPLSSAKVLYER